MNSKVFMVIRIIFALALLFFGANKLFHFMDPPPSPEESMGYWTALMATKTIKVVALVEIVSGLTLLLNKYAALMMIILMSVSVNAILYHIAMDPAAIGMAVGLIILNIVMLYGYKDKYKELFN